MANEIVEIISSPEMKRQKAQSYINDFFTDRLDKYLGKLDELADGIWILNRTPDGSVTKTYRRPPDPKTLAYILNRVAGSPTQQIETSSRSEGVKTVQNILKSFIDARRAQLELTAGSEVSKRDGSDTLS